MVCNSGRRAKGWKGVLFNATEEFTVDHQICQQRRNGRTFQPRMELQVSETTNRKSPGCRKSVVSWEASRHGTSGCILMYVCISIRGCPQADKGRRPCNQLLLNDPLLDDHPVMKSITVSTALQMETRSEHNDKPTEGRTG